MGNIVKFGGGKGKQDYFLTSAGGSHGYTHGVSLTRDLGSIYKITKGYIGGFNRGVKIEGSQDNATWTLLCQQSYTTNGNQFAYFDDQIYSFRYIKFTVLSDNSTNTTVYSGVVFGY